MTATQTPRLDWVDAAKGLSIILVVMMHSAYGVGDEMGGTGVLHYVIGWATPFRMPEFFLISGLFLAQVIARPWARYLDRRVLHYLYFYFLWAALQIVVKVGLGTGDIGEVLTQVALSVVDPYGVLWFIYMLALYSLVAKLLHELRVPHWAAFGAAALLQIAPIHTGLYTVDHFAEYAVYFYAGYAFAPTIFRVVEWAPERTALAVGGLLAFAVIQGVLVFGGGSQVLPKEVIMGWAALPVLHLALGFTGSLAVCVTAALLMKLPVMNWLRWLGAHSIVVYLSFSIPMAASRTILMKLGVIDDVSVVSILVMLTALLSPLVLYWMIQTTGWGKFLFERPDWAHLPGTNKPASPRVEAVHPAE